MEEFNPEKFLILVVDDNITNIQLVGSILNKIGYDSTFATNGNLAIERVKSVKPDLILLDLMMPDINGLEVCKIIKSHEEYKDIPIIFLTASNEQENLIQAFERGAVDYIVKPFNKPELLARVRTHLELKHTRDELRKTLIELEKLATTDPLTNLPNRRHFFNLAEKELNQVFRDKHTFSILMIDVDHFTQINNTYLHSIGDEALKLVAKTIHESLRKVDFCGRLGGEEFVVFLPETNTPEAMIVAERLRKLVAEAFLIVNKQKVQMTVSIGVATYDPKDATIDAVLKRADEALYQAKDTGRNKVVQHKPLGLTHSIPKRTILSHCEG
ncbi:MAG: PleD family two-component system response regulator [Gomphosphaeria aponina SAG 52.96 = DSM 107014]|uniref:PleD family two-component system response regulator n=1 Tax=Gomphosphaeria aponina SAG 52.96 = DSM 107014 TaxID=1521640 RepID=A0A941GT26_9CHRO|nr:PleD family two-component system response regulator [Gomphosphaeria aponina SAG 52.96 = DSM 107014]